MIRLAKGFFETGSNSTKSSSAEKSLKNLTEIKLFKFLKKLLTTYTKSKDNLTKECFAYTSITLQN